MRIIRTQQIIEVVRDLCMRAAVELDESARRALQGALEAETSPTGKEILKKLLENAEVAEQQRLPLCQDTGTAVLFVDIGQDVHIAGGDLRQALNEGVRQGYRDGYLRASIASPLSGTNTGDNTPAVIHYDVVPGDRLHLTLVPKGGGAENMSRVTVVTPAEGEEGIVRFVVDRVRQSGANPCPPIIAGVGVGGTFERAALLAKRALLRPVGEASPDPAAAMLEQRLLTEINRLGIGPQGLGGRVTALAVHALTEPRHIAGVPVAVNIQCHCHRHKEASL